MSFEKNVDVSMILPIHNGEPWLQECLDSVRNQIFSGSLELSVFLDSCTDRSMEILSENIPSLRQCGIECVWSEESNGPFGVGYAKNQAVKQSSGNFLCFLDCDDVMSLTRVASQFKIACNNPTAIVGSMFHRLPEGSTERYTKWANSLTPEQLYTQIFTSHGPTVIMPTWFCSLKVFREVGSFCSDGKGTPEDLIFFYKHLRSEGKVLRVDEDLMMYRYHLSATTFSVSEDTIWNIRLKELSDRKLSLWDKFTIWNAGKQGRKFYRSLSETLREKVVSFCDVDEKKILKGVYIFEETKVMPRPRIPIVHFKQAMPPFVICVKQDLTGGGFESNLKSLCLQEDKDYVYFS